MFGYSLEELQQQPMHELIHHHRSDGSFYPRKECVLENALHQNQPIRGHRDLFFRKDGSAFPASCSASPINEGGVAVSAVIEVRDITREIEAEQALRTTAAQLEQKVSERTEELRNTNEHLKQFTYAASHDLQEPLRKISFFVDRLLSNMKGNLTEDDKRITDRIKNTTGRMRSLIDDLLSYSNTSMGTTKFQEVDLNFIIKEVMDDMEATIIEKEAKITIQELPPVKGDVRQLKQLLQNLLSNALKYHKQREAPEVQISGAIVEGEETAACVPTEKRNRQYVEIKVKDNGIGFNQDYAEKIFGLFHRLHGKAEYEGTGVGLAIVQKVVENHEGFICVEGELGVGATFKVLLPAD
jgi:PAS domain S-box-containing protein